MSFKSPFYEGCFEAGEGSRLQSACRGSHDSGIKFIELWALDEITRSFGVDSLVTLFSLILSCLFMRQSKTFLRGFFSVSGNQSCIMNS